LTANQRVTGVSGTSQVVIADNRSVDTSSSYVTSINGASIVVIAIVGSVHRLMVTTNLDSFSSVCGLRAEINSASIAIITVSWAVFANSVSRVATVIRARVVIITANWCEFTLTSGRVALVGVTVDSIANNRGRELALVTRDIGVFATNICDTRVACTRIAIITANFGILTTNRRGTRW